MANRPKRESIEYVLDVTHRGTPLTVHFRVYHAVEATEYSDGAPAEMDIDAIYISTDEIDEFEISALFGEKSLALLEEDLWNALDKEKE